MLNNTRISIKLSLNATISVLLILSLVVSGTSNNFALAKNSLNEEDLVEMAIDQTEDEVVDVNLIRRDDNNATSDLLDENTINDNYLLSDNNSDSLPELKENSWRYIDGQRTDNELDSFSTFRSGMYDHSSVLAHGIDISEHQGNIDWATAKNYVDFVIIRAGYAGNYDIYDDKKWLDNVQACERYGIPYGVYLYSYAENVNDANSEADHLLRLLSGHRPTYPVYIDMEDKVTAAAGRDAAISIALTVCERIEAAGYTPGIYANLNWWRNYLNDSRFDNYERWVAQYNYRCDYDGDYRIWQYSSKGSVPGIAGYVDMNYDYGEISESAYQLVYNYDFYKSAYSDLRSAYGNNRQAYFRHFIRFGINEGRQGSPLFDFYYYKGHYGDLVSTYGNDNLKYYTHFMNCGWDEGRMPSEKFDIVSYYNANADLRSVYGRNIYQMYLHYNNYGYSEGRTAFGVDKICDAQTIYDDTDWTSVYSYDYYLNNNLDVKSAYIWKECVNGPLIDDYAVLRHFYLCGMIEGRRGNSTFDIKGYYNCNEDLRVVYGSNVRSYYLHYCMFGSQEGRSSNTNSKMHFRSELNGVDYSSLYDGEFYTDKNDDLKTTFSFNLTNCDKVVDDTAILKHLVNFGMNEKRQPSANFNVDTYKNRYEDLQVAYGNNWRAYYLHYMYFGVSEKRTAI